MATELLTSSQKRWLRGQAHGLKPVVRIGKHGLSPGALAEIDAALSTHELIKVHHAGTREEKEEAAGRFTEELKATVAGAIGNVVILYRQQEDPEKRSVELPG